MGMCRKQRTDALLGLDEKLREYENSCQHLIQALVSSTRAPCISLSVVSPATSERCSHPRCLQEALKAEGSQQEQGIHAKQSAGQ